MAFDMYVEHANGVAKITMSGELEASTAPRVLAEIQNLSKENTKRIVFFVQNLDYIASAGLRVILLARQRLGSEVYWIGSNELVLDTLQLAGFDQVVKIRQDYDPAETETH